MPPDGDLYCQLMAEFGFKVRQGGPEEDYYQWYGHHIWNPFRPDAGNYMAEDFNTPFVVSPQGAVIGVAGIHHGVFQDMSAPAVKRQFLQLLLNWRYANRSGSQKKVWCWGWGSHSQDFNAESASRRDMVDVIQWLDRHFAKRATAEGQAVMTWATQADTARAYLAWEASHPGQSSFSFQSLQVDWQEYPYLRPVAECLRDHLWQADQDLGPGVEAYQLAKDGKAAVIAWSDMGSAAIDVTSILGPKARVVGLETGTVYQTEIDASRITVGVEPVFITAGAAVSEDADNLLVNPGFEQWTGRDRQGFRPGPHERRQWHQM